MKIGVVEKKICQKAFCSLYGVSRKRVEGIINLLKNNVPAGTDKRGKHFNRPNKIPENILKQINDHIKSFSKRTSHYSRNRNENKFYLSPQLNMSTMHKLYLQKYEPHVYSAIEKGEKIKPVVSYEFFCRHFNSNYNYSFGKPRSDTCQTCDTLDKQIVAEINAEVKLSLCTEKDLHIKKAKSFYTDLKSDIYLVKTEAKTKLAKNESQTSELLTYDFQQNMPLPHVPAGDVFYKRQLWVYNFCIYVASSGKSYFFVYNETVGRKGQNDVVSFLNYFINKFIPASVKTLYVYSDNCSSQNKNYTLAKFFYSLTTTGRFEKVIQRFPEPGHSFLPCDRSFGVIGKEKRKHERVYLPEEYINIITSICKTFVVINVTQDMI